MRRPNRADHLVARRRPATRLHQLLKSGLIVLPFDLLAPEVADLRAEQALHQRSRRLVAAVQEDRRDDRLERVGQDRLFRPRIALLGRLAQTQVAAELEPPRGFGERGAAYQVSLELRQAPLVHPGERPQQGVGDHETERRVAEELERLVVGPAALLVGERRVGQRACDETAVPERVAEPALELRQFGVAAGRRHRGCWAPGAPGGPASGPGRTAGAPAAPGSGLLGASAGAPAGGGAAA